MITTGEPWVLPFFIQIGIFTCFRILEESFYRIPIKGRRLLPWRIARDEKNIAFRLSFFAITVKILNWLTICKTRTGI